MPESESERRERKDRIPVSCPTWRRTLFDVEASGIGVQCRSCRARTRHVIGWERIDQMRREIEKRTREGAYEQELTQDLPGDLQIEMAEGLLCMRAANAGSAIALTPAQALSLLDWLREREMALRHWPLLP